MSDRKRKRGRPRQTPIISYEAEMRMRNNVPRTIKKPKYLLTTEGDDENSNSRASTPGRLFDDKASHTSSKNSRGYNPDVEDKNSEFHYGSDFETLSEPEENESDALSPYETNAGYLLSDDEGVLSDNDSQSTPLPHESRSNLIEPPQQISSLGYSRPVTPEAIWFQDQKYPPLILPPSADDLFIPLDYLLPALSVYENLRHFRTLVRLSPFRFEDFCGSLINPQQTVLLADVHTALLKALIREDESQSTHFGPIDHKDSMNIMLYSIDPLTWPQVLYNYLNSDLNTYKEVVKMLEDCNYPFTSLQNRLLVLRALSDAVLSITGVREELVSEGKVRYDDHCRSCHKVGDLLCCDSCTAVYHINCIDRDHPPLSVDDWTCSVCIKNKVDGVTDCLSASEASGMLCRHDPLGYDRHGRKYWFLSRRLVVETNTGEVRYYSSKQQVMAIYNLLDGEKYEYELVFAFREQLEEIQRQLSITEELTNKLKGSRPSVLSRNDDEIEKFIFENAHAMAEDEDPDGDNTDNPLNGKETGDEELDWEAIAAKHRKYDLWGYAIIGRDWKLSVDKMERVLKEKQGQLKGVNREFRLGADSGMSYVNQYSQNALALNKLQHNEDRDKKRQLWHKFSVNSNTEFKWTGTLYGSEHDMVECLRSCLQQMEQQISNHLYHPHWSHLRKAWLTRVSGASKPSQFRRCLTQLASAIKPIVFHNVWHDSLGHIRLLRVTAAEREERRRQEKKDKKEVEIQLIDDFRHTLLTKFTKIPKHQLWKIKGEEYRLNVGEGWQWSSKCRRVNHTPASTVGLRAGPDKIVVGVNMSGSLRGLPVNKEVYQKLSLKTPQLISSLYSPQYRKLNGLDQDEKPAEKNEIFISNAASSGSTEKVEVMPTPLEDYFEDGLVNVSKALVTKPRLVYNKMPLQCNFLDGLLARRLAMKNESTSVTDKTDSKDGVKDVLDVKEDIIEEIPDSHRQATHRLRPAGNLLKEIRQHKLRYESLDESSFHYKCYSTSCSTKNGGCYSPLCRGKLRVREKLVNAVKNYTIVTSKPSPFPQVGTYDIIKLSPADLASEDKKPDVSEKNAEEGDGVKTESEEINVKVEAELDESSQNSCGSVKDEKSDVEEKTNGKIYLRKLNSSKKVEIRLPQLATCTVGSDRHTLLSLPKWEVKMIGRRGWKHQVSGFSHSAKSNPTVWPYQCPRPVFRHTWLYRTALLDSLSAVALQMRIMWSCLRWDDMNERGSSDGKKQITTDTENIQTEILKRKFSGRFNEITQYLRRTVTISLEGPKATREFTPSQRSGLRKRRRALSPENKMPESVEKWVGEEQLSLWEIRFCGERLEKASSTPSTKRNADTPTLKLSVSGNNVGFGTDFKLRIEEQLKQQRAAFQQQQKDGRTLVKISPMNSGLPGGLKTPLKTISNVSSSNVSPKKFVKTKDGRVISVQTLGGLSTNRNNSLLPIVSGLPKVQIPSNGPNKVIRLQTVPSSTQRMIIPRAVRPQLQPAVVSNSTPNTIRLPNQNIQILRMPDGQIQVKGLLENQQMIQRPDGKFQLINKQPATSPTVQITQQKQTPIIKNSQQPHIVKLNGQQMIVKKDGNHIVSVGANEALKMNNTHQTQIQQIKTLVTADGNMVKTVMPSNATQQMSMQQQIASNNNKKTDSTSITLRVQVRMTEQGPKTIIQGLHSSVGLTKDHIRAIQQQVRTMLTQYDLKVDQLSPIMTLTLHVPNSQVQGLNQNTSTSPQPMNNTINQQQILKSPVRQVVQPSTNTALKLSTVGNLNKNNIAYVRTSAGTLIPASSLPQQVVQNLVTTESHLSSSKTLNSSKNFMSSKFTDDSSSAMSDTDDKTGDDFVSSPLVSPTRTNKRSRGDGGRAPRTNKRARVSSQSAGMDGSFSPSSSPTKQVKAKKGSANSSPMDDPKRRQALQVKLDTQLGKHKEHLKKDILKKRAILEKDLEMQIHRELSTAKKTLESLQKQGIISPVKSVGTKKRKKSETVVSANRNNTLGVSNKVTPMESTSNNKKQQIVNSKSKSSKKKNKKSKKIVCTCRTPFDDSKFYVGCDMCANWFHGDCVGISESLSRTMTEYVCEDCTNAKVNKELYCVCKQPYDETQFYICCERCEDWYHGKCIGIMQGEADEIDDYICPQCEPNNTWNQGSHKTLSAKDCTEIKKINKMLLNHKDSWPFMEAVNPSEVPDYYKVVKTPMDLKIIENRVKNHYYKKLAQYIGDVMLLFDNCRLYNPPNSSFVACALNLESFFCSKVKLLKQKLASS